MKRLNRLFKNDGKTVIIALDHGMGLNVNPALDKTEEIITEIIKGGADALLVTPGIAARFAHCLGDVGIILRCDGGYSALTENGGAGCPKSLYSVKDALRMGADAVMVNGFPGTADEQDCMKNVAQLVSQAKSWNVPVVAEMLPGGFAGEDTATVEKIVLAARIGCEYGANVIKTKFAGTAEEYRQVVQASYQPVVILGGEATGELPGLFSCVEQAMSIGVAGVAIGRNVWKAKDPQAVTRALVALVHNQKTAKDVLSTLV